MEGISGNQQGIQMPSLPVLSQGDAAVLDACDSQELATHVVSL